MDFLEIIKAFFYGIIEGITEWLPISSTGHLIIFEEFFKLEVRPEFLEMFRVVIQLGAILAVLVIYWNRLLPLSFNKGGKKVMIEMSKIRLWGKILIACLPAAIIGLPFDDFLDATFYNFQTVAATLIIYGIGFIIVENYRKDKSPLIPKVNDITYKTAALIGIFQVLALIPGTSRSGATILGAIILGVSRVAAAEFTFFLAIPVMLGASLLKIYKFVGDFGFALSSTEAVIFIVGLAVSFVVSIIAIKFLIKFIQNRSFKVFGWYRIALGVILLGYFFMQ